MEPAVLGRSSNGSAKSLNGNRQSLFRPRPRSVAGLFCLILCAEHGTSGRRHSGIPRRSLEGHPCIVPKVPIGNVGKNSVQPSQCRPRSYGRKVHLAHGNSCRMVQRIPLRCLVQTPKGPPIISPHAAHLPPAHYQLVICRRHAQSGLERCLGAIQISLVNTLQSHGMRPPGNLRLIPRQTEQDHLISLSGGDANACVTRTAGMAQGDTPIHHHRRTSSVGLQPLDVGTASDESISRGQGNVDGEKTGIAMDRLTCGRGYASQDQPVVHRYVANAKARLQYRIELGLQQVAEPSDGRGREG
mmetsp:Transcript_33492/g.98698  ORF Transcript_33492/g.98698 Transcript_33492/m.98698 type:complete len:301 (+) Transcript_33492:70-972(+)